MSGLSIQNNNNNNSNIQYNYAQSKDNSTETGMSERDFSLAADTAKGSSPTEPTNVLEPVEFANGFQIPYEFENLDELLDVSLPEDFDPPFSIEMPVDLSAPSISEGAPEQVMQPFTLGDGGVSKSASSGKKITEEALGEKYKCSTCESRKYVDGSTDPGVSFKFPTKVSKESANSAVAAHEQQHVRRNRNKAEMEGREVVSSTVQYHSDVCDECGDVYRSGGTTTTVTREKKDNEQIKKMMEEMSFDFEI